MKNKQYKTAKPGLVALILTGFFLFGFGIGFLYRLYNSTRLKDGEYNILVCTTTDVHGAYFDSDYEGGSRPSSMARFSSYLKFLRDANIDPVVVDCGDALQGDNASYFYNYVDTASHHVFASMADYLRYDAMVVGNHDIETGHSVYDRMKKQYSAPLLAANAIRNGGKRVGKPYFEPYTIIRRNNLKIAVIGMTNANIGNWLAPDVWKGIDFLKAADVAQKWVDKVSERENPDIIILAMHSGFGDGSGKNMEAEGKFVASQIKGVDLVILGHDHIARAEKVENPEGDVTVINGGSRARSAAQAVITVAVKDRKVVSKNVSSIVLNMDSYQPDPDFVEHFRDYYLSVRDFACRPIGSISKDIDFSKVLDGPSAALDLIHRTQLFATGARISITAPLTTEGMVKAGDVAFKDLASIYRFENHLYTVKMTGKQIRNFLELAYYNSINKIGPSYNYDSADGINYTVSLKAPKWKKVNITSFCDGSPFCQDSTYTVAINSYRACGGGYLLRDGAGIDPTDLEIIAKYKDIRTLVGEYINHCGVYEPRKPDNWKFVR